MNDTTDRNWLIRTAQKQILGPVTKQKVIDFVQKGALSPSDEICSGNGYWFHIREQDLLEKYLLGDIPQSYNPISESKTVLARKDAKDQTTSMNANPANITQVIKLKDLEQTKLPSSEDLEFPDITIVAKSTPVSSAVDTKLPVKDDLEYPDITIVAKKIEVPAVSNTAPPSIQRPVIKEAEKVEVKNIAEEIILPSNDDLEYPDENFIKNSQKKIDEDLEIKFEVNIPVKENTDDQTKTILSPNEMNVVHENKVESQVEITGPVLKLERRSPAPVEPSSLRDTKKEPVKMLHERRTKASAVREEGQKQIPKANPNKAERNLAPELKNRNDSYLLIILVVLILIVIGVVFYYYRFILNKPLPV